MSFEWSHYVDLAEELINHGEGSDIESAYFRSAVSRAYYGVYCIARDMVEKNTGKPVDSDLSHVAVRNAFIGSASKISNKVGKELQSLHSVRKNADYDSPQNFNKRKANKNLEKAKRILKYYEYDKCKLDPIKKNESKWPKRQL